MEPTCRPVFQYGADALLGKRIAPRHTEESLLRPCAITPSQATPTSKHDELADQAQLLGNAAYPAPRPDACSRCPSRSCGSRFGARPSRRYLHLPTARNLLPLVIVSGGIDSLQVDFTQLLFPSVSSPTASGCLLLNMRAPAIARHCSLRCGTPAACTEAVLSFTSRRVALGRSPAHRHGGEFRLADATWRPPRRSSSRSGFGPWSCFGAGISQVFANQEMFARCPHYDARRAGRPAGGGRGYGTTRWSASLPAIKTRGIAGESRYVPILKYRAQEDFICPESRMSDIGRLRVAAARRWCLTSSHCSRSMTRH